MASTIRVTTTQHENVSAPIVAKIASEFAEFLETIGWEIVPVKGKHGTGLGYEDLAAMFVQHILDDHGKAGQLQ